MDAQQGPIKVPLIATLDQRAESPTIDSRLVNGYVEKMQDGTMWAVKRPGVSSSIVPASSGTGLGCFYWQGDVFSVSNGTFFKNGVSFGAVNTAGGRYYFTAKGGATTAFLMHNSAIAYDWDPVLFLNPTTAANALLGGGYFTGGAAYLDGTSYLGVNATSIYGSNINDYTTWNALNLIAANMLPDSTQYIFRQLAYVVALKQQCFQAFYDAGNANGSPLASAPGTFLEYGCRDAGTVAFIEGAVLWMTATLNGGLAIMSLENMKPKIVSTPAVERVLQQASLTSATLWAFAFRISGHRFYVLTSASDNFTLVLDIDKGIWYRWTDANGNYLPYSACTTTQFNQVLLQHATTGTLYVLESTNYDDAGAMIPVDVYTPNWDGGSRMKKYNHRIDFIADQQATGVLKVRHSDNDYKTFSNFRNVDLSTSRPSLFHNGTFRKRAWHCRYEASTAFRMRELEIDIQQGAA